jgi:hypothetical protein
LHITPASSHRRDIGHNSGFRLSCYGSSHVSAQTTSLLDRVTVNKLTYCSSAPTKRKRKQKRATISLLAANIHSKRASNARQPESAKLAQVAANPGFRLLNLPSGKDWVYRWPQGRCLMRLRNSQHHLQLCKREVISRLTLPTVYTASLHQKEDSTAMAISGTHSDLPPAANRVPSPLDQ